jgi:hypothetical protein
MKVTMNDPILNVDGAEVKQEGDKALLFVDVIITSMTSTLKTDVEEKGEEMLKKWNLAERAQKARGDAMDITTDESAFIKERIRKVFASTVIYANAHRLLEAAAGK